MVSALLSPMTHAENQMLCARAPTAYVVGKTPGFSLDPCTASAKIQAIAYECGSEEDTLVFQGNALEANKKKAQEKCEEYCKGLDDSCTGQMDWIGQCGLKTEAGKALSAGKNIVHCHQECKGQAFNYCSIYHGNFLGTGEVIFKKMKENCHCRHKDD